VEPGKELRPLQKNFECHVNKCVLCTVEHFWALFNIFN
jgi:hypothetical protein